MSCSALSGVVIRRRGAKEGSLRLVWAPITLEEWRRRMKWHDPAETVMDWDGLLYDGWEPAGV